MVVDRTDIRDVRVEIGIHDEVSRGRRRAGTPLAAGPEEADAHRHAYRVRSHLTGVRRGRPMWRPGADTPVRPYAGSFYEVFVTPKPSIWTSSRWFTRIPVMPSVLPGRADFGVL